MADPGKLGLIAGGGDIPVRIAEACADMGRPLFVVRLQGFADAALARHPGVDASLGQVGLVLSYLKREGCAAVTFVGKVPRPDFRGLKLDARGAMALPKVLIAARQGDDALLRALIEIFEAEGLRVVGPDAVLSSLAMPAGVHGRVVPRAEDWADIARAVEVGRALGALDVGQAVAVADGLVLAIEAAEGTDALLTRVATLDPALLGTADRRRGVLVKLAKSSQERRIDLPTIGVRTVDGAARAGLAGIAVEAGASLVSGREAVREAADAAGVFVIGFDPDRGLPDFAASS